MFLLLWISQIWKRQQVKFISWAKWEAGKLPPVSWRGRGSEVGPLVSTSVCLRLVRNCRTGLSGSSVTPEDPEVALPLWSELKIERQLQGDHDGGRKEGSVSAFPALLSPHNSFVIPLSASVFRSVSLLVSLLFFFYFDGKLFFRNTQTDFTSARTGTTDAWKSLWDQRCNKWQ